MSLYEVDINQWFQDALRHRLCEHVRQMVELREKSDQVMIDEPQWSCPEIDVRWRIVDLKRPTDFKKGTESFTLAQVMQLAMTEPQLAVTEPVS